MNKINIINHYVKISNRIFITLIVILYTTYGLFYSFYIHAHTQYSENYDAKIGGGRNPVIYQFTTISYVKYTNYCPTDLYQIVAMPKNETIHPFITYIINEKECYNENEIIRFYPINSELDILFDSFKQEKAVTVKHSSFLAIKNYKKMMYYEQIMTILMLIIIVIDVIFLLNLWKFLDNYWLKVHYYFYPEENSHFPYTTIPSEDYLKNQLDDCCAICFEKLNNNIGIMHKCGHIFHRECIDTLFSYSVNAICPKCRVELMENNV